MKICPSLSYMASNVSRIILLFFREKYKRLNVDSHKWQQSQIQHKSYESTVTVSTRGIWSHAFQSGQLTEFCSVTNHRFSMISEQLQAGASTECGDVFLMNLFHLLNRPGILFVMHNLSVMRRLRLTIIKFFYHTDCGTCASYYNKVLHNNYYRIHFIHKPACVQCILHSSGTPDHKQSISS